MFNLQGSIVALVTPMDEDGTIDWQSFKDLIEWHINSGSSGLVIVGTTGESATLNVAEHVQVIENPVNIADGRIKIIAGTGANSTKEAVYLTNSAKSAGADAALIVTPYYNRPSQEGLYRHYSYIADEVSLPQILYNVPSRTGCDLLTETVMKLVPHDNVVGLKDATGNLSRLEENLMGLKSLNSNEFILYSGDDPTAAQFILKGGSGSISVTANVVPSRIAELCNQALAGNKKKVTELDLELKELNKILFIESNPIPVKWILNRLGRIPGGLRLPLVELDNKFHNKTEQILKELSLLN